MKNQFVTYEIAKKLKELGFNEECLGFFYPTGTFMLLAPRKNEETTCLKAPLWQQAIDWLREKYKFNVCFDPKKQNYYLATQHETLGLIEFKSHAGTKEQVIIHAISLITK
jgi:hypothetical protein